MSEFTTQGKGEGLNLYTENTMVRHYSDLDDKTLTSRIRTYMEYDEDTHDLMPRARAEVRRILAHLAFEYKYRQGGFDSVIEEINSGNREKALQEA